MPDSKDIWIIYNTGRDFTFRMNKSPINLELFDVIYSSYTLHEILGQFLSISWHVGVPSNLGDMKVFANAILDHWKLPIALRVA